jgi:D-alanyl-D-alanine carboxypeptidase
MKMTPNDAPSRPGILAALQVILEEGVAVGIPGLTAAIYNSRGKLWEFSAGCCNLENKTETAVSNLFGIGSITKAFLAVVILQLVDESRLKLSYTVRQFLNTEVIKDIKNADAGTSTIEALLSHRSGIESWYDDPVWIANGRGRLLDPKKIWTRTEALEYITHPGSKTPSRYSYSNTNYTLLGLIIEEITNDKAEAQIRKRILEPLNLNDTYLEGYQEPPYPDRVSSRYHWATKTFRETARICQAFSQPREDLVNATRSNISASWTAGCMISSSTSIAAFTIALRDGCLLSHTSMKVLQDWNPIGNAAELGHGAFRRESKFAFGRWIGHSGSVLGFSSTMWWKDGDEMKIAPLRFSPMWVRCMPGLCQATQILFCGTQNFSGMLHNLQSVHKTKFEVVRPNLFIVKLSLTVSKPKNSGGYS